MIQELQDSVRIQINRHIYYNGFAPTATEIAKILNITEAEVKNCLKQLADNHAIVLHPNSVDIWAAHPFALFPTLFWVETEERKWWGNCTWCSLGIASLTKADTKIFTKISGEIEPLRVDVVDGVVIQKDLLVHFPIPAKRFWDNVIYTCSNMLIFKNEAQISDWCVRHNVAKGQVLTIGKVWELSKIWYGDYLLDTWTRKTPEYAESLFRKVGLTGDFWKLR